MPPIQSNIKTSPPPRDTHLSWAKKVMLKTTKRGNIGTPAKWGTVASQISLAVPPIVVVRKLPFA